VLRPTRTACGAAFPCTPEGCFWPKAALPARDGLNELHAETYRCARPGIEPRPRGSNLSEPFGNRLVYD
jgi:hypothetical protein